MVGCWSGGEGRGIAEGNGNPRQLRAASRAPPRSAAPIPSPPAALGPAPLPGEVGAGRGCWRGPGSRGKRRHGGDTRTVRTRPPAAPSAAARSGEGHWGRREGAGPGGRCRRGYFERRPPARRVPFPFLGFQLAGQVAGPPVSSLLPPHSPVPGRVLPVAARDAAGAAVGAGGGGKGAVQIPFPGREKGAQGVDETAGPVLSLPLRGGWSELSGQGARSASAAARALSAPAVCDPGCDYRFERASETGPNGVSVRSTPPNLGSIGEGLPDLPPGP